MAQRKKRVSKKARMQKGPEWFNKAGGPPEPGAVWHKPFEYKEKHGLVVKVKGHWERHKPKPKAPTQKAHVEVVAESVERVGASPALLKLARKNSKKENVEAKEGEPDA